MARSQTIGGGEVGGAAAIAPGTGSPLAMALLLSCVMIWGVNAVAYKVAGPAFDPLSLTGLRSLAVSPCLTLLVALTNPSALRIGSRSDVVRYLLYALISVALGETLMVLAVHYTSVANMTLLGPGTIPLS